jgi:hypothetical protein
LGVFYGLIFGIYDVEDSTMENLNLNLISEEYKCIPIACVLGFIEGVINEFLRIKVILNL